MSVNHLNNLPFINSSCLFSERHLQAQTICRIHNGLDGRFDNSTRAQFNEHAVAYFMFAHTNVGAILQAFAIQIGAWARSADQSGLSYTN